MLIVWWQTTDVLSHMFDVWCQTSFLWCSSDVWCLLSDHWCQMSHVCGQISDIWCLTSVVWCQTSDAYCLMSAGRRLKSDVRWLMSLSGVWCLMSDVWCLLSDVSRLISDVVLCQMSDGRCLIFVVFCQTSDFVVWCQASDIRRLMFVVCCEMSDAWCQTSDVCLWGVWYQTSDVCCLMSHVKRLIFFVDVRHLISDIWCLMSDVWCLLSDIIPIKTKNNNFYQPNQEQRQQYSKLALWTFFYQYLIYTPTVHDMQPMIIIIEYMLEQIIVNFSFNFFASKLCESIPMSLKLSPPNSFRAYYELHLLSEQKWNNGTAEFLQLILPCCNNSLLIFPA